MSIYAEVMYKIARDDRDVAFLNLQASSFGIRNTKTTQLDQIDHG